MKLSNYLFLFGIVAFLSCGETAKNEAIAKDESSIIEGFWKRTGMVQFVNGVPVDTLYYANN